MITPQFNVVFKNSFITISNTRKGAETLNWNLLAQNLHCYTDSSDFLLTTSHNLDKLALGSNYASPDSPLSSLAYDHDSVSSYSPIIALPGVKPPLLQLQPLQDSTFPISLPLSPCLLQLSSITSSISDHLDQTFPHISCLK